MMQKLLISFYLWSNYKLEHVLINFTTKGLSFQKYYIWIFLVEFSIVSRFFV